MMTLLTNLALTSPLFLMYLALEYGPRLNRYLENERLDREQYGDRA